MATGDFDDKFVGDDEEASAIADLWAASVARVASLARAAGVVRAATPTLPAAGAPPVDRGPLHYLYPPTVPETVTDPATGEPLEVVDETAATGELYTPPKGGNP